ncbi:NUDIX domain-containing protein [Streptomyces sp. enrichment culture]|uniref:NUDIX domain-containing protein n=1 Tax=Streptomyces sp. enrichment culture TaxID=1795815 RepID=UPI003F555CCD
MTEQGRSADELLDIVDEQDRVVGQRRRGEVYARRLRHRSTAIRVRDERGRIFVHRRTPTKLIFPGMYDVVVGGVVGAGEDYDSAALREAEEELGVSGLPMPERRLKFLFEAPGFSWFLQVYEVVCTLPVRPQAEEVDWWDFLEEDELERRLAGWEAAETVVPDGLECHRRLSAR